MISSKQSLSFVMKRVPKPLATQDGTITLIRNFSKTNVLERRINTRRPRPWCYEKQLVLDICKPKYPPNPVFQLPSEQRCQKSASRLWLMEKKALNEENIYEKILAKEILELFEKSKMVAIVHRHSMLAETKFDVRVAFKRIGMQMRDYYGRRTIQMAVADTKYASILPLFKVSEALIFSPEVKVDALLNTMKKTPQVTLLATIVDGHLLSKTETEFYASTNLATQQALLVQTINSVPTSLTTTLNQHAQTLVGYLDQHAKSAGGSLGTAPEGSSQAADSGATVVQSKSTETSSSEGSSLAAAGEISAAETNTDSAPKEASSSEEVSKEASISESSPKAASSENSDADLKPKSQDESIDSSSSSEGDDKGKSS
uniref:Large ribosomal subunit protein uL10m n=1 Tax=Cacopsylla melanoneura TaxID=428564 RepID=A0A8D9AGL6_9HEMI